VRPVVCLVVVACGGKPAPHAPAVEAPCTQARVGKVLVVGAERADVAALAVLEGTLDDQARADRITRTALDALRFRGHAQAAITVTRKLGCFVELTVTVDKGPRFEIETIDFETQGSDKFPAAERLAVIEDALGTVNTVGGVFIRYRLERALTSLEQRYRDAGWLDARIGKPASSHDDDGKIAVSIPIAAGARYRIGAIRARGKERAARATVLEELGVQAGNWYDAQSIRRGLDRVQRKLDRRIELHTSRSEDGTEIELEAIVGAP
jgi:outer membrane protein assembly factor BamA